MPDYAAMYKRLFQAQTLAIEILQKAQMDTEEMYIRAPELNLIEPQHRETKDKAKKEE